MTKSTSNGGSNKRRQKKRLPSPRRFETAEGRVIYAVSIETFPGFFNNVYVLDDGERLALVDTGSGFEGSNEELVRELGQIEESFGRPVALEDLDAIIITHAHSDHFGGLGFVREHSDAPVSVHALDVPVVSHYEERVITASRQLDAFLMSAGLSDKAREGLMRMYKAGKDRFVSVPVDQRIEEGDDILDGNGTPLGVETFHVPGHCPGQICIRVDDVLLTADHVLERITPHQAPEAITLNTGLQHYLESLAKIEQLDGIRLGLGGHENPIEDTSKRCREIAASHDERLAEVLDFMNQPRTTAEVSKELFGGLSGYTILLGLEEAGAHVEYLHLRGEIEAANLEELEDPAHPEVRWIRT